MWNSETYSGEPAYKLPSQRFSATTSHTARVAVGADRAMTPEEKRVQVDMILQQKAVVGRALMTEPAVRAAQ